jgi:biopolymer transport protein ExbB
MGRVNQLVAKGDYDEAQAAAESQPNRPTSNIIKAGLALRGCSVEVVENGLSGAVLRELPRLERFLTALKVLAAVAPLLGLLGTVTGMINTFHVITIFGTGNPRLMAGGISEALVTTQLGLAVAIPILVASALLGRKAQSISDDMEEKAMAMSAALIGGEA